MGDAAGSGGSGAVNIEIKVNTAKFEQALSDLPDAIARAQRVALNQIGNTVKNRAIDAFRQPHYRPSPWAPRKNNVDPERPLLYKHGDMLHSIAYKVTAPDTVVIGSKAEYAKFHQTGTKHMPARPFFPVDKSGNLMPDVHEKIMRKVEKAFADEIKKTFGH